MGAHEEQSPPGDLPFHFTVRVGQNVRVRVSGEITLRLNPAFEAEYCQGNPLSNAAQCGRPPETVGAEGVSGGMLVVGARIRYPDGDWVYVPLSPSPLFPGERVGAWQARADGVVEFMRTGHHWVHGGIPVFAFGGSQSISLDVTRQEAKLKLDCTGGVVGPDGNVRQEKDRVTRGQALNCIASRDPTSVPGEVTITRWSFDGKERTDGEVPSTTWGGVMVRSGAVKVEGKVGDRTAEPATASITVLDRDWSTKWIPFRTAEDVSGALTVPERPRTSEDLGKFYPQIVVEDLGQAVPAIETGPNAGLAYLSDLPFAVLGVIRVNRAALAENSEFWRHQPARKYITALGEERCGRGEVVPFISVVLKHEGISIEPKSHAFFFQEELQKHSAQPIESLTSEAASVDEVAAAKFEILTQAEQWVNGVWLAAAQKDNQADSPSNAPLYCTFRYFR